MKKDFFTTKRLTSSLLWIGLQILSYALKKFLELHFNIKLNNMIMENFGLIISCSILVSIVVLLVYWKIKDIISNYINWLNLAIYDHALRISLINAIISSNPNITGAYLNELNNRFTPSELAYLGFTSDEIKGLKPIPKDLNEKIKKVIMDYNNTQT